MSIPGVIPLKQRDASTGAGSRRLRPGTGRSTSIAVPILGAVLALGSALGALFNGYYDLGVWGPLGIGIFALLLVALIVARQLPPIPALIPSIGLAVLGGVQMLSATWAESASRAFVEGHRTLVYAAFAALVAGIAQHRLGRLALAAGWLAGGIVLIVVVTLDLASATDYRDSFLSGRLFEPVGYVNGMSAALVLAAFPLVGLAEGSRSRVAAGLGAGGATFSVLLMFFVQSRGATAALALTAAVSVVALPGWRRRVALYAVIGVAVAVTLPALQDVWDSVPAKTGLPDHAAVTAALRTALIAAAGVALVWLVVTAVLHLAAVQRVAGMTAVRRAMPVAAL